VSTAPIRDAYSGIERRGEGDCRNAVIVRFRRTANRRRRRTAPACAGRAAGCALGRRSAGVVKVAVDARHDLHPRGAQITLLHIGAKRGGQVVWRSLTLSARQTASSPMSRPPAMEMRCALRRSRTRIAWTRALLPSLQAATRSPPHDLHSAFIDACKRQQPDHRSRPTARVEDFEQDDDGVTLTLTSGERVRGRA